MVAFPRSTLTSPSPFFAALLLVAGCSSEGPSAGSGGGAPSGGGQSPTSGGGGTPPSGGTSAGGSGGNVSSGGGAGGSGGQSPSGGGGSAGSGGVSSGGGPAGGGGMEAGGGSSGAGGASPDGGSGGMNGDDGLKTFVYVGSGDWGPGEAGLVTVYEMNRDQKALLHVSEHPAGNLASFLAIDAERHRLFVADEGDGGVISFSIDPDTGSLTNLGPTASGNNPVYLSLTPDGAYLFAANYNQGNVDVYPIGSDGVAQTPVSSEPTGAQAHCIVMDDQNRVLVANKGAGTLSHFTFSAGTLAPGTPATTPRTSPRHIFYGPGARAYVVSEEADEITGFDIGSDGSLSENFVVSRLPAGGNPQTDTGADVQVTPSGKFLYATNRGNSNTIVAYDLQGAAPELIEHEPSQGTTPRNFAIDPLEEFLIVGNHGSDKSLATFTITTDGSLEVAQILPTTYSPFFVGIVRF